MTAIPQNQREKHPELYPLPKDKDQYINHIIEMCDDVSRKRQKRTLSQMSKLNNSLTHYSQYELKKNEVLIKSAAIGFTESLIFECKVCGKRFNNNQSLYDHYDEIHNQGNNEY